MANMNVTVAYEDLMSLKEAAEQRDAVVALLDATFTDASDMLVAIKAVLAPTNP